MEKSYKDKLFELVYDYRNNLTWKRDEKSNYSDYECEIGGIKLRVVSHSEGDYLQVLRTCADYRCYDKKDYPKVSEILDAAYNQWVAKRDEVFFKDMFSKVFNALGKNETYN